MNLPLWLELSFVLTTLLSLWFLFRISNYNRLIMAIGIVWTSLQLILGYLGFFEDAQAHPYRFPLLAGPALLLIILGLSLPKGRRIFNEFDLGSMTLVHVVRIPVELCLYYLFLNHAIPEIMTFDGRNFDILAGITAPIIYYFAIRQKYRKAVLIAWNLICLVLLLNIVSIAILSLPLEFQKFGLEQPNYAVLQFPFTWLPSVVVPIVLLSHLLSLRSLLRS